MSIQRIHLLNVLMINLEGNEEPVTAASVENFFDIKLSTEDIVYIDHNIYCADEA